MAEVLIATMLAGVLIVSVLVVLTQLMAVSQKSSDLAAGAIVAERLMSDLIMEPNLQPGAPPRQGVLSTNPQGSEPGTDFHYRTDVAAVDNTQPDVVGQSLLVTVDVWWQVDKPDQTRNQVGKLSTRLSRIIYRSNATPQP